MTLSDTTDDRVLFEVDADRRIATITLNNPMQRNSYDAGMREQLARYLDVVAEDDDITVVLLRGAEGSSAPEPIGTMPTAGTGTSRPTPKPGPPSPGPASAGGSRWTASHSASITI